MLLRLAVQLSRRSRPCCAALLLAAILAPVHAAAALPAQCAARPASPACQRARAAAAREQPAAVAAGVAPLYRERVSVRLQLGLGGGPEGEAERGALELQYWLLPQLGVGTTLVSMGQTELLGSGHGSLLVGPVLSLRTRPRSLYVFASVAAGYRRADDSDASYDVLSTSSVAPTPSPAPRRHRHGVGAALMLGAIGRVSLAELGWSVAVDVASRPHSDAERRPIALTGNLILGLALD